MRTFVFALTLAVLVACTYARNVCSDEKGEEYQSCGTACPDTCDNYNEVRPCTLQCVPGCFCPRGTVRRESDSYCVKVADC